MSLAQRIRDAHALLARIAALHAPAAFGTSFGAEDMVLLDMIAQRRHPIEVFTLDTGRLPEETHTLMARAAERYRIRLRVFCPDAPAVEQYVRIHGVNAFYHSVAQRKECCHVRKVEPLTRALAGRRAWVTGLRREQSPARAALPVEEFDPVHSIDKFNPLADWTLDDVWSYIRLHDVPYNALHDRGYPSIGCAPCTRAVSAGEDLRAGRWWWEAAGAKECGLHPLAVGNGESKEDTGKMFDAADAERKAGSTRNAPPRQQDTEETDRKILVPLGPGGEQS
jgi:phosphoadenosine phosphosulfate reductase